MKFSEINNSIVGKNVKINNLKNSKLEENEYIKVNKIYKIYNINKNFLGQNNLTLQLIDEDLNLFWVSHYDVELIE